MNEERWNFAKKLLWITLGGFFLAIALHFFLAPSNIAGGGLGGFAIILNQVIPSWDIGTIVLIGNIALFAIGFLLLGKQYGILTLIGSMIFSLWVMVFEWIAPAPQPLVPDKLLIIVLASGLNGLGLSFIFDQNASSGGTDILAQILHSYLHIAMAKALFIVDGLVVLLSAITLSLSDALYAGLTIYLQSVMIDQTIAGFRRRMVMNITTSHLDEVNYFIIHQMHRGTSIYPMTGGFSGRPLKVIVTVVHNTEYFRIRDYVDTVDPEAFVFVYSANEVMGEGFTYPPRKAIPGEDGSLRPPVQENERKD
ncbi:MAG: YitT family protein [Peptoniphilaceae bacterium]|nr:YitT family protein [Peptoniphilaceae bacterium]MDY6085978.1 YitT family protein [Peptoniphilaceae bacterium]